MQQPNCKIFTGLSVAGKAGQYPTSRYGSEWEQPASYNKLLVHSKVNVARLDEAIRGMD